MRKILPLLTLCLGLPTTIWAAPCATDLASLDVNPILEQLLTGEKVELANLDESQDFWYAVKRLESAGATVALELRGGSRAIEKGKIRAGAKGRDWHLMTVYQNSYDFYVTVDYGYFWSTKFRTPLATSIRLLKIERAIEANAYLTKLRAGETIDAKTADLDEASFKEALYRLAEARVPVEVLDGQKMMAQGIIETQMYVDHAVFRVRGAEYTMDHAYWHGTYHNLQPPTLARGLRLKP